MNIREGYMPYLEYRTYYRMVGENAPGKQPLLLLHGGPGSTHNYFEVLDQLAEDGRAVIMYDQLGCGGSITPSRPDLWHAQTWLEELKALRRHLALENLHLLGQSWGGMLAIQYLCDERPTGIVSLILSSTLPSVQLWQREGQRNVANLPEALQVAIRQAVASGDYDDPAYQAAETEYMRRHCFNMPEAQQPECVRRPKKQLKECYVTAWGPNEFTPAGTLKDWEYLDKLPTIQAPTLIISGLMDLCTPLVAKTMQDAIPDSRWELFEHSRHMAFVEENDKYVALLRQWLNAHDQA